MTRGDRIEYSFFQLVVITLGLILYHKFTGMATTAGHGAAADIAGLLAIICVGALFGIVWLKADADYLSVAGFNVCILATCCIVCTLVAKAWGEWWVLGLCSLMVALPAVACIILGFCLCIAVLFGTDNDRMDFMFGGTWIMVTYVTLLYNFVAYSP